MRATTKPVGRTRIGIERCSCSFIRQRLWRRAHHLVPRGVGKTAKTAKTGKTADDNNPEPVRIDVSVVLPVYNEEGNIGRMVAAIAGHDCFRDRSLEVVCVDDGSTDGTAAELDEAAERESSGNFGDKGSRKVRVLSHRRRSGQTQAIKNGLGACLGDYVVTMDGDYQSDPVEIPKLLGELEDKDRDLVQGYRESRAEKAGRVFLSRAFNRVISKVAGIHIIDSGCGFKAMKRWVAEELAAQLSSEMHRFIPYLAVDLGAKVAQVPVTDLKRQSGKSKYTALGRLPRVLLDFLLICLMRNDNAFFFLGVSGIVFPSLSALLFACCFFAKSQQSVVLILYVTACTLVILGFQSLIACLLLYNRKNQARCQS